MGFDARWILDSLSGGVAIRVLPGARTAAPTNAFWVGRTHFRTGPTRLTSVAGLNWA